ncbi:MAG: nucleotidyltransferase family protein [Pyrinomonadaceae bacterium]
MVSSINHQLSRSVARALAGAWRAEPPLLDLTDAELSTVACYLLDHGGAEFFWRRIAETPWSQTALAGPVQEAFRYTSLLARLHEIWIQRVFEVLRDADIPAILVKGWGVARQYPEPGMRPYVDIDIFVDPAGAAHTEATLIAHDCEKYFVEVHAGPKHLDAEPITDWFARSSEVQLGKTMIRLPAHEDHFRALCVHWLHHGAVRAAGLCDIALFIENFGADMDWDLCLRGSRQRAGWIACTVGLAHELFGANTSLTPLADAHEKLPRWMVPLVLDIWSDPLGRGAVIPPPLRASLAHPLRAVRELRARWPPNPLHATIETHGSFNDWPRLPYQAANFVARTGRFLSQLPKNLRKR